MTLSTRTSKSLHIQVTNSLDEETFKELTECLTIFAATSIYSSNSETVFVISGPSLDSPLTGLILDKLAEFTVEYDYCIMTCRTWKYVPLHDLYDFQSKKWKLV